MKVLIIADRDTEEWLAAEDFPAAARASLQPLDQAAAALAMMDTSERGHEVGRALVAACPQHGELTVLLAQHDGSPVTSAAIARIAARIDAEMPMWLYVHTESVAAPAPANRWRRVVENLERTLRTRKKNV